MCTDQACLLYHFTLTSFALSKTFRNSYREFLRVEIHTKYFPVEKRPRKYFAVVVHPPKEYLSGCCLEKRVNKTVENEKNAQRDANTALAARKA